MKRVATTLSSQSQLVFTKYLVLGQVTESNGLFELTFLKGDAEDTQKTITLDPQGLDVVCQFLSIKIVSEVAHTLEIELDELMDVCQTLVSAGILSIEPDSRDVYSRYDRNLLYYDLVGYDAIKVQSKLSQSRIGLLGMGGIGNWVASGLIGAGFESMTLIDFDQIEMSNLTRQILFTEHDIGRRKIDAAAERLRQMNTDTAVEAVYCEITNLASVDAAIPSDLDLLVVSADSPSNIHALVDQVCYQKKIPYIRAGYRNSRGSVGPLIVHGQSACYECFKSQERERLERESAAITQIKATFSRHYQAPSFGAMNAVVGSLAVAEIMKFVGGFGSCQTLSTEININLINLEMSLQVYEKDSDCRRCGQLTNSVNY